MTSAAPPVAETESPIAKATAVSPDPIKGAVAGIVAGLVGSLAIDAYIMTAAKMSASGARALKKAQEPAGLAAAKVIEKISGQPLSKNRVPVAGATMHYLFGAGMGLTYGLAAEGSSSVTTGAGAAFGAGSSLVLDVMVVPAMGLDEPPWVTSPGSSCARSDRTRRVRCRHGSDTPLHPPAAGMTLGAEIQLRQPQPADHAFTAN